MPVVGLPSLPPRRAIGVDVDRALVPVAVSRHRLVPVGFEELVEKRAVVAHRLSQVLGRLVSVRARLREPVTFPVVLDHARVIDRDVAGPLLEVLDRIPALRHHRLDEAVRGRNGTARIVDELSLNGLPVPKVAIARRLRKRLDVEPAAAFLARVQLRFGIALRIRRVDEPVVLRPETLLQPAAPPTGDRLPGDHTDHSHDRDRDDYPNPRSHDVPPDLRQGAPAARIGRTGQTSRRPREVRRGPMVSRSFATRTYQEKTRKEGS